MPLFGPPNVNKMKAKGNVKGLIKALSHENLEIVNEAAIALGQIGKAAIDPLIAALKDEDMEVRSTVEIALKEIGRQAVQPLIAALNDNEFGFAAKYALKKIGEPAVQPLIAALKDKDKDVRRNVAYALYDIRDPRCVEPLIATLKDKEEAVRTSVIYALAKIGDSRAIEPIIASYNDPSHEVRSCVSDALGDFRDPRVLEPLITALKDTSSTVRWYTIKALEKINDLRSLDPLLTILNDEDEEEDIHKVAASAVRKLNNFSRLTVNDDGTVTDKDFGLIWQRASDNKKYTYEEALSYCGSLKLAGQNDWRLPSKTELMQLTKMDFKFLKEYFPGINAERYWATATADQLRWAEAPERIAYTVDFDPESGNYGKPITYFKIYSYFVRAVRREF